MQEKNDRKNEKIEKMVNHEMKLEGIKGMK